MSPKTPRPKQKKAVESSSRKLRSQIDSSAMAIAIDPVELGKLIQEAIRKEFQSETGLKKIIRDEVAAEMVRHKQQLDTLTTTVTEQGTTLATVESSLSSLTDRVSDLESENELLRKDNVKQNAKIEKIEKNSRCHNVRVCGLENGVELGNPTSYMNALFRDIFKQTELPQEPAVEIAHRLGPTNLRCRTMIVRMERLDVQQAIVKISKAGQHLEYKGMTLKIYQDLTSGEQEKRAVFKEVREKLFQAKIKNGVSLPAGKLLFTFDGEEHSFVSPKEALEFYSRVIVPSLTTASEGSLISDTRSGPEDN